jgi:hypothetical protein
MVAAIVLVGTFAAPAQALDRLCDPANENCRTILINYIRNESVGIDVGFWFMEDARYTTELIRKHQAGVPVRVLMDPRANASYVHNADRLAELQAAGIPMRKRIAGGILHYKMMLFAGQNVVEFSGANFSADAFVYSEAPYVNYVDEVIYFTDDSAVVNSFRTKFDDLWTNVTAYANYANITTPPVRHYDTFPRDPELNFPPSQSYANRAVGRYNAETQKIDVVMYRITDRRHTDAIINAKNRGVAVRLISEPKQYRDPTRLWHSWNIDRLYMAGVQIKHRQHAGLNHQKLMILYGQRLSIFGSSNWTSPSDSSQEEHNYFTAKPDLFTWLVDHFERKWNNSTGVAETTDFVPLPPDRATTPNPVNAASGVGTASVTLKWFGGPWAHKYDVYFGTTPTPPLFAENLELGPSESSTQMQKLTVTGLAAGTTYYWRVVSKTMANMTRASEVWSFTTAGTAAPPPPTMAVQPGEIVLYAGDATTVAGAWRVMPDSLAAGAKRITHPNAGAAKITSASAAPADYFELTFTAEAGRPYRLWIRGRGDLDAYANDSVFVQFSGSTNSSGAANWRIGTNSAAEVNIEDCSGCGLAGWGWQDNGYGVGILGPVVYFNTSGAQAIRVQTREDGLSIDQIVLSPSQFLTSSPGTLKNDTTILPKQTGNGGETTPPPPPPAPPTATATGDVVLYATEATVLSGAWTAVADPTAAGGARLRHPDAAAPKITAASGAPADYFEMSFDAEAGKPYRLWLRGKADNNYWGNDSVYVQFTNAVDQNGSPIWSTGTSAAAEVNLEDCSGCGLAGWGWQDNGYGTGVMGPLVYFAVSGPQTIRIQTREDGLSIDQIVLSPERFLNTSPGALKNDTTIVSK